MSYKFTERLDKAIDMALVERCDCGSLSVNRVADEGTAIRNACNDCGHEQFSYAPDQLSMLRLLVDIRRELSQIRIWL